MKRIAIALCALALLHAAPAASEDGPHFSIHLVPASEGPCALMEDSLRCADINTQGDPRIEQLAYIVLSQFDSMQNLRFGIGYDDGVTVTKWIPCYGKYEYPMGAWPASGTGTGLAFDTCIYPAGPDSLLLLGVLVIEAGSWGRIWVQKYSADEHAYIMTCDTPSKKPLAIKECALGEARVHGLSKGRNTCGPCPD